MDSPRKQLPALTELFKNLNCSKQNHVHQWDEDVQVHMLSSAYEGQTNTVNSTQKGPSLESHPGPSYCEATELMPWCVVLHISHKNLF